jgi:hypothetical protein
MNRKKYGAEAFSMAFVFFNTVVAAALFTLSYSVFLFSVTTLFLFYDLISISVDNLGSRILFMWGGGSSVSIVSGYGLDDRAIEVRSPAETRYFL